MSIDPSHLRVVPAIGGVLRRQTATFFVVAEGLVDGRPTRRMLSKRGEPGSVRQWLSPGDPDVAEFTEHADAITASNNAEPTTLQVQIVPAYGRKREVMVL